MLPHCRKVAGFCDRVENIRLRHLRFFQLFYQSVACWEWCAIAPETQAENHVHELPPTGGL
jgi:hypothetical protein